MSTHQTAEITPETQITLSAAELQQMLREVAQGGGALPPGAYRENGEVFRDVSEPTGRIREIKAADGKTVVAREQINRRVRRRVYLTYDMSPNGVKEGKRAAQRSGLDFWHPQYGWLRNGQKREVDVPENLGSGAERFEMEYVRFESEDDIASSSATIQGVPIEPDMPSAPEPERQSPFSDEALESIGGATRSSRRNREN